MNILAKFGSNGLNAFRKEDRNVKKLQWIITDHSGGRMESDENKITFTDTDINLGIKNTT